jgi:esterase/lipase
MRLRLVLRSIAAALGVAAIVFVAGPRNARDADAAPQARSELPADPAALPAYFATLEARVVGIMPGTEKRVTFGPAGAQRSRWAVVYLHGFSASRQETAPLPEHVAEALQANLFATRLTGHGRGGAAMAEASVAAWKADALEALQAGRRLGERVLVVGVSTGATLAVWLAQQPEARDGVAWVLVSPNFGPARRASEVINWPWGQAIARWVTGPEYGFGPRNPEHGRYWTTRYPVEALFPMMASVELARRQPLEAWQAPVLMLLSPTDKVIDVAAARAAFQRIGSPAKRLVEVGGTGDPAQHVIAGRILSPKDTDRVAKMITDWVASLNGAPSAPLR